MEWFRAHQLALVVAGAVLLVLLGSIVVFGRLSVNPGAHSGTWGEGVARFNPGASLNTVRGAAPKQYGTDDLRSLLEEEKAPTYASLATKSGVGYESTQGLSLAEDGTYTVEDIESLFASLKPSAQIIKPSNEEDEQTLADVYQFIPAGAVGTSSSAQKRSRAQTDLYNYGNDAGSYIESYYEAWGKQQAQVLKRFFEDRGDPKKREDALSIAEALGNVGQQLGALDTVPESAAKTHAALAAHYKKLEEALIPVLNATDDAAVIAAIDTYNKSADAFAKTYIDMASIFSSYGVSFRDDEPGRVFVFRPSL